MTGPRSSECGYGHGPDVYIRRSGGVPFCRVCVKEQARARRIAAGLPVRPATVEERFWSHVDRSAGPDACWPWRGARRGGYGMFTVVATRGATKHQSANRFALGLKLGREVPTSHQAAHTCDNPPCVNPAHLFEATPKENAEDSVAKKRRAYGDRNPRRPGVVQIGMRRAALSGPRVQIVRLALAEGIPGADIAAFVGCSPAAVSRIRHGSRRAGAAA